MKKKKELNLKEFEKKEVVPTILFVVFIYSLFVDYLITLLLINIYNNVLNIDINNTWLIFLILFPFIMVLFSTMVYIIYMVVKESYKKYIS